MRMRVVMLPLVVLAVALAQTIGARSQSLDLQAACAAQAKKAFQEYSNENKIESARSGQITLWLDYQSHYNTKINKCLIQIENLDSSGTSSTLMDANERRLYAAWLFKAHETKKYSEQPPIFCKLMPSYQETNNCKTREEFDAFVAGYMEE